METLDQASRGPLGAIKFLISRRTAFSPTLLGVLVVILSLVVDPFTQQVVSFKERPKLVPSNEVWAPRVSAPFFCYTDFHIDRKGNPVTDCANIFQNAHQSAIWEPESYRPPTHAQCFSGNCEWEPFHTIEYCVDKRVVESPSGYCDISFNQSDFNEGYTYYNETGNCRIWIKECSHIFKPLNVTRWEEPYPIDLDGTWDTEYSFGTRWTFPDTSNYRYELRLGSETSIVTGFQMKDEYFNPTHTNLIPRLVTRFPTEVISLLDKDREENNIVNESGERIPDPLVIMAHTCYDIVPESISDDSGGYGYYVRPVELRARLTEWSALSLCQVERKITVVNGTTLFPVTESKYLRQAYPWYDNCWAPEDYLDGHGWMPAIFSQQPTGSFSMDDIWPRTYQANVSAGAFCLRNATIEFDLSYLLTQAFRGIKATNTKGEDVVESSDGQVWYQRWGKPYVDDDEDISVRASRIFQRTLPAIMTLLTAGLNNINYGATNETVTGSYVLRETILVMRWGLADGTLQHRTHGNGLRALHHLQTQNRSRRVERLNLCSLVLWIG